MIDSAKRSIMSKLTNFEEQMESSRKNEFGKHDLPIFVDEKMLEPLPPGSISYQHDNK